MPGKIILIAATVTMTILGVKAVEAIEYPWCAYYSGPQTNATNCGFNTLAQCQATISGIGGMCQPNPAYKPTTTGRSTRSRDRN